MHEKSQSMTVCIKFNPFQVQYCITLYNSLLDESESREHEPVYPIDCSDMSDVPTFSQSHHVPDPSQVAGTRPAESEPVAESHTLAEREPVAESHTLAEREPVAESHTLAEREPIEESHHTETEAAVVSHPIPFQQQILHVRNMCLNCIVIPILHIVQFLHIMCVHTYRHACTYT